MSANNFNYQRNENISGIVERITFNAQDTGYSIARLKVGDQKDLVTIVGNFANLQAGQTLKLYGYWKNHPKYGLQFCVLNYEETKPADITGIEKYLGSGLIKGVGPVTAKRIVKHFGLETLNTIKTIADYPFLPNVKADFLNQLCPNEQSVKDSSKSNLSGHLTNLTYKLMKLEKCPDKHLKARRDLLRKDIQFILKPYQILPKTMRNGYFLGTGILSERELIETFRLLQTQAKNIDDPLALNLYNRFKDKMKWANFYDHYTYPVRAIANRSMIDIKSLDSETLSNQTQRIQEIIEQGKLVTLNKFANRGSYEGEEKGAFCAWLLQIVFYNFAWYLGFEQEGGENHKLFRFERLDRLYIQKETDKTRTITEQKKALNKLTKLLSASYGLYLGNDVEQQKLFLSSDKQKAQETVELWFTEKIFGFIAEGTKRFPTQQMKMTKPPRSLSNSNSSLFSLSKSKNP